MPSRRYPSFPGWSAFACLAVLVAPWARGTEVENAIGGELWVISAEWATQLPPSGTVSAPSPIEGLSPDQEFALGITATGPDRDAILTGCTMKVVIEAGATKDEEKDIQPIAIRDLVGEGVAAFAVFPINWIGPPVRRPAEVRIRAVLKSKEVRVPSYHPAVLFLKPWSDWAQEKDLGAAELGTFLTRYHDNLQPGLLLPMLRSAVRLGTLRTPAATEYFARAFVAHPAARAAALESLDSLDVRTCFSLLLDLRSAGLDVSGYAGALPKSARASIEKVEPLPDPRTALELPDPVTPASVYSASIAIDRCWGVWMATGDPAYLRPVVELLGGAPDYPDFVAASRLKAVPADVSVLSVARGCLYQIAGWSIASFERTDPRVADWVRNWRSDPTFPPNLKEQLNGLDTNPAFRHR